MEDFENSLGDGATFVGRHGDSQAGASLGDQGTLGDAARDPEVVIDNIEVVDLEARYAIEGTLGRGGMGEVLLAVDTRLDRKVAIKRILGEAARSKTAVDRFLTEAKSIAALNHPNVVQIYDYGRAKDGPFLIMEYVDGSSLLERCREGALPEEEAIDLACQLCDGLGKAHDLGIVHRDIKPANVLLTKDGTPKLTDFGLAKAETSDQQMTMAGAVLGTPDFMPPEQRRDASEVDARSDLWSLAATLYQMVTGRSPKVIRLNEVPSTLQEIIGRALEDEKPKRYQTARAMRDALRGCGKTFSAATTEDLDAGECPACGTRNDGGRKFCKKCAGTLEAPCLACHASLSCWEKVCGQCGARQDQLSGERRRELLELQTEASDCVRESAFGRAREILALVQQETDPRFLSAVKWVGEFSATLGEAEAKQTSRSVNLLHEARRHEGAFDYASAIEAIRKIPEALRTVWLPECDESAREALVRVEQKESDLKKLYETISECLANKQYNGLLQSVQEFLILSPNNQQVQKLAAQLSDREDRINRHRAEVLGEARKLSQNQQYEQALGVLAAINKEALTQDVTELQEQIQAVQNKLLRLKTTTEDSVKRQEFDGLLRVVEEYLELKKEDQAMNSLREKLLARENQLDKDREEVYARAVVSWKACRFEEAADLIGRITPSRQDQETQDFQTRCFGFATRRAAALERLAGSHTATACQDAINTTKAYLDAVSAEGLVDVEIRRRYEKTNAQYLDERIRRRKFVRIIAFLCVFAVLLFAGGSYTVWMTLRNRAAAKSPVVAAPRQGSEAPHAAIVESMNRSGEEISKTSPSQGDADRVPPSNKDIQNQPGFSVIENSVGMTLKRIPFGKFEMGDETGRPDEMPHEVIIQKEFYISESEVTNLQWTIVMAEVGGDDSGITSPVTDITWYQAVEFCKRLSEKPEEQAAGRLYRLPTEEEWEYACRAGRDGKWGVGDNRDASARSVVHRGNSTGKSAGAGRANAWGLLNMNGNVAEWCADIYRPYTGRGAEAELVGGEGMEVVVRGGSFLSSLEACRSAYRERELPSTRRKDLGFRVIAEPAVPQ